VEETKIEALRHISITAARCDAWRCVARDIETIFSRHATQRAAVMEIRFYTILVSMSRGYTYLIIREVYNTDQ